MIYDRVLKNPDSFDFSVQNLGICTFNSLGNAKFFVNDVQRISFSSQIENIVSQMENCKKLPGFEKAGPRSKLFHCPPKTRAAIVTCGGLCPGLNNVIKSLVNILDSEYGVSDVIGYRYGYRGLSTKFHQKTITLNRELVDGIHKQGGTILGSSRGAHDPTEMVDKLLADGVNILFCVGGDGTLKGAQSIAMEATRRNAPISIVGVPKTIDNDIEFVEKTFGFETAVETASKIIMSAHYEAEGAENGIGIVKLMGRDSGFIAATASLANSVVDFCLVPEVEFHIDGPNGLIAALEERLATNGHALIVVAEGAGQHLFEAKKKDKDPSGNVLKEDIGELLKAVISRALPAEIKYLDPSYHIRSVPAIASDAVFCYHLAEHAVHAAMAGKTNVLIGYWNNFFTHVPIALATVERRELDLDGVLWRGVMSATQQGTILRN